MFEWIFNSLSGIEGPNDLSEEQRSRVDDEPYVPQANSLTTATVVTNNDDNSLGEYQILRTNIKYLERMSRP